MTTGHNKQISNYCSFPIRKQEESCRCPSQAGTDSPRSRSPLCVWLPSARSKSDGETFPGTRWCCRLREWRAEKEVTLTSFSLPAREEKEHENRPGLLSGTVRGLFGSSPPWFRKTTPRSLLHKMEIGVLRRHPTSRIIPHGLKTTLNVLNVCCGSALFWPNRITDPTSPVPFRLWSNGTCETTVCRVLNCQKHAQPSYTTTTQDKLQGLMSNNWNAAAIFIISAHQAKICKKKKIPIQQFTTNSFWL